MLDPSAFGRIISKTLSIYHNTARVNIVAKLLESVLDLSHGSCIPSWTLIT